MPLFGNKKKPGEQLRALTEKEIQNKLYGHLRKEGPVSGDRAGQMAVKHPAGSDPKMGNSIPQASQTSSSNPSPNYPSLSSSGPSHFPASPAQGQQEKISRWVNRENEGLEKKIGADYGQREKENQGNTRAGALPEKKLPSIGLGALFLVRMAIRLVQIVAGTGIRFILSVDFRKPSVRRIAYWLAVLGLLAAVFLGIHILNIKRESAMKESPRQSGAARKPKVYQPIFPSLAVLPIADPESSQQEPGPLSQESAPVRRSENQGENPGKAQKASAADAGNAGAAGAWESQSSTPLSAPSAQPLGKSGEAADPKGIVIQIATFAVQEDAEKLSSRLAQDRFPSFVRSLSRPGGRVYYCVFLGSFKTHHEAETLLVEFRKREIAKSFKDAFIRSL